MSKMGEGLDLLIKFFDNNIKLLGEKLVNYFKGLYVNIQLKFLTNKEKFVVFKKEIFMVNFGVNIGSEYEGIRPALVVSGGSINIGSICLVIPITSFEIEKTFKYDIILEDFEKYGLQRKSILRTCHIQTISKNRLIKMIGKIDDSIFDKIKGEINNILSEQKMATSPKK